MMLTSGLYLLENELNFYDPANSSIAIHSAQLSIVLTNSQLSELRLTFQLSWTNYEKVRALSLFHLIPELRESESANALDPNYKVWLATVLNPELLPELTQDFQAVEQVSNYLVELNQNYPHKKLFATDSWFCVSVKQDQPNGEKQYRTFWDYLDWSNIASSDNFEQHCFRAMISFLNDSIASTLPAEIQGKKKSAILTEIASHLLDELSITGISRLTDKPNVGQPIISELESIIHRIADVFDLDAESTPNLTNSKSRTLIETTINFFKQEEIEFSQFQKEPVLLFQVEGEHGEWNCRAKADEENQLLVFYSIVPIKVSEQKRGSLAEFLSRANYGLAIGNFEMDFADGEIRYKTSVDVEGSKLDLALLRNLVYTNIFITDRYLPGIMSVIYSDVTPVEAISQIEN